jgi:plastocyanin
MISSTALFLLSLPLAFAQYGGSPPAASPSSSTAALAPSPTGSSSVSIQTVTVGQNGQLGFSPNNITAAVGSQVEFIFFPPTHSVVQASFAKPCQPINDTGFYSGAFNTASGSNVSLSCRSLHVVGANDSPCKGQ